MDGGWVDLRSDGELSRYNVHVVGISDGRKWVVVG